MSRSGQRRRLRSPGSRAPARRRCCELSPASCDRTTASSASAIRRGSTGRARRLRACRASFGRGRLPGLRAVRASRCAGERRVSARGRRRWSPRAPEACRCTARTARHRRLATRQAGEPVGRRTPARRDRARSRARSARPPARRTALEPGSGDPRAVTGEFGISLEARPDDGDRHPRLRGCSGAGRLDRRDRAWPIVQTGTADVLLASPATAFVADFAGTNLLTGIAPPALTA